MTIRIILYDLSLLNQSLVVYKKKLRLSLKIMKKSFLIAVGENLFGVPYFLFDALLI